MTKIFEIDNPSYILFPSLSKRIQEKIENSFCARCGKPWTQCKNSNIIFFALIHNLKWWCLPKQNSKSLEKRRLYKLAYQAKKSEKLNGRNCEECKTPLQGYKMYFCSKVCEKTCNSKIHLPT